uniref:F-BAR domain only protein 2 n=1 Tax=Danio rerio TaxID=7955 RepID=FCHO2_DANRE|nr:F-BAR domain only protein 2 [Danio rerio]Q502I9.1 RecName: Full=F-BAR domain only protein 2 [Danio rerio]AAH95680.1 FCH domain only 2 [Danio rerio]|eukprot:NP_001018617.1 F-BAR domain only protein 2 [Danio rerio]
MITPYFLENFWGNKNSGFYVLYHNMKHGQISSKELSDFIRERATIEEAYSRSMTKLAKTASNFSQLGTFAPVWDVFKQSTEKLAACHMELVRKLQELIKEVQKYVDEQAKNHKKTKEEVASTLEAVHNIQSVSQALLKSKENYINKTLEQERMRKEGAKQGDLDKAGLKVKKATESYKSYVEKYATAKTEFEQRMTETAQKFQGIEEEHILRMQEIIHSYSLSVEETHIQIGEVQQEFVNNMENTSVESLIEKLAESRGTGKERPGPIEFEECNVSIATEGAKPRKRKTFAIPGRRKEKDTDSTESTEVEAVNASNGAPPGFYGAIDLHNANVPQLDDEGFCIRPEVNENDAKENSFYSSSDSEDEDEPRKFHVQIKPVQTNNGTHQHKVTIDELKASIGNISLSPTPAVHMKRNQSNDELARPKIPQPPLNDRFSSNDLLSLDPFGPTSTGSSSSLPQSSVPPPNRPTTPLGTSSIVPPPRPLSRPKLATGKLTGITESGRPFSPPKLLNSSPPPPAAPLARAESFSSLSSNTSLSASNTPTVEDDVFVGKLPTFEKRCETPAGTSRGPSPVTLASQDALPIAVAFTESVNAYFKGADPSKCIVKITGDMTLSFPSGIIKIFTSSPSPAVLSFKLLNASRLEQIMPNQQLLHSDSSQSDTNTKDFWMNMPALTSFLRKSSEQNPAASYYNVDILKYQVCSNGIQSTPLNLVVYWKCSRSTTDLRVDYRYNPEAMQPPAPLTNVQVLVPVNGGVMNMQSLPNAIWNAEQNKSLWKLSDISDKSENEGSGSLRAKFELSEGPSIPATLAVQFFSEGSSLSGVDMELAGSGYRLSLNKKRFATGRYMADC